jgi:hypothetical protein
METVEELKSTRLIIELLQQELSAKLTSTKNDVVTKKKKIIIIIIIIIIKV